APRWLRPGGGGVTRFPWPHPPRPEAVQQSLRLLEQLDLVHMGSLTELGQSAARLPVHPRLGRLLIEGQRLGHGERAALAAALLSAPHPFVRRVASAAP